MDCIECWSTNTNKRGFTETSQGLKQRYKCTECGKHFSILAESVPATEDDIIIYDDDDLDSSSKYVRSDEWLTHNVYSKRTIVITAVQNNTELEEDFLQCLNTFVQDRDARLIAIPIKYKTINASDDLFADLYDQRMEPFLVENTLAWPEYGLKVYAGLKIQATAENPLSGLDPLSKGSSIIIGHAQVQLKTLPNLHNHISSIITSTGVLTQKNYSNTKIGEKARFNHSLSAIVVEFDTNHYHLRHLNYDPVSKAFCDLDKQYSSDGTIRMVEIEAIVTGDEHTIFKDENVEQMTYLNEDSVINVLRPKYIVRGDVLDSYSISHHHRKNVFTQYAKWQSGMNSIEAELEGVIEYINKTTPEFATSIIVQSNHNEHLLRWLNDVDIKVEPWNAKIYHYLMYRMLKDTSMGETGTVTPNPLELMCEGRFNDNISFIDRSGMSILDIEVGQHGDYGVNGARGSAKSFARMPEKMIVGHSHSPSIEKGAYVVGTSSKLRLEYNKGASTWHHAHCIIHKNGKRQLLFITPDGWRL